MRFVDAVKIVESVAGSVAGETEKVVAVEAIGRIVAEDTATQLCVPQYSNSAVDGFAVRVADTRTLSEKNPRRFPILGTLAAGDLPPAPSPDFGVWQIMTGAPFPADCDASVKIEEVEVKYDERGAPAAVLLNRPVVEGENFRARGEDFTPGRRVVRRGEKVRPAHILALAALGINELSVFKRPTVALLATGKEIVAPGEIVADGKVRDSTGPYLRAALEASGAVVKHYGRVGDDPKQFVATMQKIIADRPNVILTTGAVSMGIHDFVTDSVKELGGQILFHRVEMRPGRPILFATFPNGPVMFGLPGNPISSVIGARFFVEPYLDRLAQRPRELPRRAKLTGGYQKPATLRCFVKAKVSHGEDGARVEILGGQASFMISSLLGANAWAVLPEDKSDFLPNESVEIFPLAAEDLREGE